MQELIKKSKINSIFTEFVNMVNESGLSNASRQFSDALRDFPYQSDTQNVKCSITYFTPPDKSFFEKAISWICGEQTNFEFSEWKKTIQLDNINFHFSTYPFANITTMQLGETAPACTFLLLSITDLNSAELSDKLLAFSTQFPNLVIIAEQQLSINAATKQEIESNLINLEIYHLTNLPAQQFIKRLIDPEYIKLLNFLLNYNALNAIESFYKIFCLMADQEERSLKAKKTLNQQQLLKTQGNNNTTITRISNILRNELNNQIQTLEKGITDSFENYMRPQTGKLSHKTDEIVHALPALEMQDKAKTTSLFIAPDFEQFFLNQIYDELLNACQEHLIIIRDSFRITQQELEKIIEKNNLPHIPINLKPLSDQQLTLILNSAVRIDKHFEGSVTKEGAMEYFEAIKKYQSVLFMLVSTFGLSYFQGIRYIMIPVTIVLLGVAIFYIHRSVVREHKENSEKEYAKAIESLKNETKRIMDEVAKQWLKVIADHLRTQLTHNQSQIEKAINDIASKRQNEDGEEKRKVERQMQGLDNTERKMAHTVKAKENFYHTLQRIRADIKQAYLINTK